MKLNKLKVKTTNNFKINELDIDLDLKELNTDKLYKVEGIESVQKIKEEKITTKVGLEFNKYLELLITIPKNTTIDKPILINYDLLDNDNLISHIIINYEENSKADLIITYNSDNNKHFNHLKETIKADKNSEGTISYINLISDTSTNIMAFVDEVDDNASITHNLMDITGNIRIYNAYLESKGYESKNYFNNIYLGINNDVIDINYDLKNIGKRSINDLKVEGALKDNSNKNFRGTIDFIEGCTKAIGEEYENCTLLSDTSRSRSLPMLLCHEEDVVGSHGESTGKVREDKLFYLMSRGFSEKEAEKLIVIANFMSIINLIPIEEVRELVLNKIENKLK